MNQLTATELSSNLTTLSEKIANQFGRSVNQGVGDYTKKGESLFLCPKSIMVGVSGGGSFTCWILDPVVQPDTSTAQSLDAFCGSLKTTVKELAMSLHSYNQNTQSNNNPRTTVRLKSVFFLLNAKRKRIASNLHFEQIKALADQNQGSVIKFQRMEAVS